MSIASEKRANLKANRITKEYGNHRIEYGNGQKLNQAYWVFKSPDCDPSWSFRTDWLSVEEAEAIFSYSPEKLNELWTITRKAKYRPDGSWKSTQITWSEGLTNFCSKLGLIKFDMGRMVIAGQHGSTQIGMTL